MLVSVSFQKQCLLAACRFLLVRYMRVEEALRKLKLKQRNLLLLWKLLKFKILGDSLIVKLWQLYYREFQNLSDRMFPPKLYFQNHSKKSSEEKTRRYSPHNRLGLTELLLPCFWTGQSVFMLLRLFDRSCCSQFMQRKLSSCRCPKLKWQM